MKVFILCSAVVLLLLGNVQSEENDEASEESQNKLWDTLSDDAGQQESYSEEECSRPLGMENRLIPDSGITASSEYNAAHGPSNARLNFKSGGGKTGAWSAKVNDKNQWLQVDLGRLRKVTHIQTQGRQDFNQWVTEYTVSYSLDNKNFKPYEENGKEVVFAGNTDRDSIVTRDLDLPVRVRYIRINIRKWIGHISMRVEILGCSECSQPLGMENRLIPDLSITASSEYNAAHGPSNARLNFKSGGGKTGAWSAKVNDKNQWLQVDLGPSRKINYIQTQGRQDFNQWVTKYTVSYSLDNKNFKPYEKNGKEVVFDGNTDRDTIVTQRVVSPPIVASYIRIHPREWNGHISMRLELLGCNLECSKPLGMENRLIPDLSITASSEYNAAHGPSNARLNFKSGGGKTGAWSAKVNDKNQWLQVDLGPSRKINYIQTQGRQDFNQWVTKYTVSYSLDNKNFKPYEKNGKEVVFDGNTDRDTIVTQRVVSPPIVASYIRIHPREWNGHISMRLELLGCNLECSKPLGMENRLIPDLSITASSEYNAAHGPSNARLNFKSGGGKTGAWSAKVNDKNQWLQVDLGRRRKINYIQTQGRQDFNQWVTKYTVSYSLDNKNFKPYEENGKEVVFNGNTDRDTIVTHAVSPPIVAKYIRIHIREWNGHISMRLELLGCLECAKPLGMESRLIPDSGITASSEYNAAHGPSNARLNFKSGGGKTGAWSAKVNDKNQWLQAALGRNPKRVTYIQTQGRQDFNQWVTSYAVSYSLDNKNFEPYQRNGKEVVFTGNKDRETIVTQVVYPPIVATYIRIHPRSWIGHISMRVEFLGCTSECSSYTEINEADRSVKYRGKVKCDSYLREGWYRFVGAGGTQLPESPPQELHCGTHATGWLDGKHPTEKQRTVQREVCYRWSDNTCRWKNCVTITNCGSFFVYKLKKPPAVCSCARYCTAKAPKLLEAAGLYPLNGDSEFADATCKNPDGNGAGLILAPGPTNEPLGAYKFAGSPNSFIEIPRSASLNTQYSITVLAWILHEGQSGPIVQYRRNNWGYHFWMTGPNQLFVRPQEKGLFNPFKPAQVYNGNLAGAWHYVGATYDYATGISSLWVDGKRVVMQNVGTYELDTDAEVRIGARLNDRRYFKGRIACVQIYDKALSEMDIAAVKYRCIGEKVKCTKPTPKPVEAAGLYPLNGDSEFADATCKNPDGNGAGLILAPGPTNEPLGAYKFAGSPNSFIEIPRSASLNTRYSITVLAWILHEGQSGPIVQYRRNNWGYHFWMTGPNQLFVRPQEKGLFNPFKPAQVYNGNLAGAWHYVGATYDYATGISSLWVDGKRVVKQNVGTYELDTDAEIRIGARLNDRRYFKGRIACVQIYDKALSEMDIAAVKYKCIGEKVKCGESVQIKAVHA